MTDLKKKLLDIIYDGINPETNDRHAFVAGAIYEKSIRTIEDTDQED